MNPESAPKFNTPPSNASKAEKWVYRILVALVFLTPLIFLPTNYVALDLVKTCLVVLAVVASVILYALIAWKEKKISLLPKAIAWSSFAVVVSVIVSALATHPIAKSFFGQGFELDTTAFITVLFVALCLVYKTVVRRSERAVGMYIAAISSFFILELFHLLRFIFGQDFASLGILQSLTSTVLGSWYALATYSALVVIIALSAIIFLPLSRSMKIVYIVSAAAAFLGAFFVNDGRVWGVATVIFFGLALYVTFSRPLPQAGFVKSWLKRLAWVPIMAFIVCALFAWKGSTIAGPAITRIGASYSELRLPWQQTIDVGAGAIKDSPILGAGPNRFMEAYIAHKPAGINTTSAWNIEFNSGFGLIPTFFVAQGFLGILTWIIFFIFLGIFGARVLRSVIRQPAERVEYSKRRFIVVSSYAASIFLWLTLFVSLQPIAVALLAFVMTGIFFGSAVSFGALSGWNVLLGGKYARLTPYVIGLAVVIAVFFGVVYAKNAAALGYFGAGVEALNVSNDPATADADFSKALALDNSDVFWQARAEAGIAAAQKVVSSVTSSSPASTTQAAATSAAVLINQSLGYSQKAIAYDPSNYYNYLSGARVLTLAAGINMAKAYDNAVQAYVQAIDFNQQNPSLYLNLAQLQAQTNHLPEALQTLGAALQVKSNYLDAIYLLSQVEAAQGNLKDAITASQVAIQLSPQSPLLFFQLGLLEYGNAAYSEAAAALEKAVALQSDYANARYFLGLSYARLGKTSDALSQFNQLASTSPDNQTVASIITALQSGKSLFAPATAPAAAAGKSRSLPLKEKSQ